MKLRCCITILDARIISSLLKSMLNTSLAFLFSSSSFHFIFLCLIFSYFSFFPFTLLLLFVFHYLTFSLINYIIQVFYTPLLFFVSSTLPFFLPWKKSILRSFFLLKIPLVFLECSVASCET